MSDTNPIGATPHIPTIKSTGSGGVLVDGVAMSLNDAVALIYMKRAETMNDIATDRAQEAEMKLKDLQDARAMLGRMRGLKQDARNDTQHAHNCTEMPPDMVQYCKDHKVDWDHHNNDTWHTADEWDVNIQYMQDHLDKLSSDNDLFMIKLKSVINKGQEATQACDGMNTKSKEVMSSIIANMAR